MYTCGFSGQTCADWRGFLSVIFFKFAKLDFAPCLHSAEFAAAWHVEPQSSNRDCEERATKEDSSLSDAELRSLA